LEGYLGKDLVAPENTKIIFGLIVLHNH